MPIFDNHDIISTIAGFSQNPNIRAVNTTAASNGRRNVDTLGKKDGTFQDKIDFVSNDGFKFPAARPRDYRLDTNANRNYVRILKGNKAVKSDVYCDNVATLMETQYKESCVNNCDSALSSNLSTAMDALANISDYKNVEYALRKINPEEINLVFGKYANIRSTRRSEEESHFQSSMTKCKLLSVAGMKKVEYVYVKFENTEYQIFPEDIIERIIKFCRDLWLGSDVKPRKFGWMQTPYINKVTIMNDQPEEKTFCTLFETEDGIQYKTYERQSQDELSAQYDQYLVSSYDTPDILLSTLKQKLMDLRSEAIDVLFYTALNDHP